MPKAFAAIPGPRAWPLVGSMFHVMKNGGFSNQLHKYFAEQHKRFGPIYYEQVGSYGAVFLSDPRDAETLYRKEGLYPKRTQFEAWLMHRDLSGQDKGILLNDGAKWQKDRSALNVHLMQPRSIANHAKDICQVANDLVQKLCHVQLQDGEIQDLQHLLFRWSLESACTIIFDRRLGCLSDNTPDNIVEFISTVESVIASSEKLVLIPPQLAKALSLPIWNKFYQNWDKIFQIGGEYVDEKIAEINKKLEIGETPGGLIASLMANKQLTSKEIRANAMDLMSAAVDTTANTVLWVLYLLSRHQNQQERLYQEICSVVPPSEDITQEYTKELPYGRSVVKETLRLYPVGALMARIPNEAIVIRDYCIPAGTVVNVNLFAMRNDPNLFVDPTKFHPERWLRGPDREVTHPFASIPFGFGPRSCIGRRIAELEMHILISKIIRTFLVKPVDEDREVNSEMKLLLAPAEPIKLRFVKRRKEMTVL